MDEFGIINMNGRLYDPVLGRFLSPDPIIGDPGNTQSYNRYSYVVNNPLMFTDPSGYRTVPAWTTSSDGLAEPGGGSGGDWGSSIFPKMGVLGGPTNDLGYDIAYENAAAASMGMDPNYTWIQIRLAYGGYAGSGVTKLNPNNGKFVFGGQKLYVETYHESAEGIFNSEGKFTNWRIVSSHYEYTLVDFDKIMTYERTFSPSNIPGTPEWFQKASGRIDADGSEYILFGAFQAIKAVGTRLIAGALARQTARAGTNLVYEGIDAAGTVRYVGITQRDAAIRFAEHQAAIGTGRELLRYRVVDGATGLLRIEARIWEQTLINQYGLGKNGGLLLNKINSIAPKNWSIFGL